MGLFPNAWTVAVREYRIRVRSRIFQIATVVLALVGFGIALIPVAIRAFGFDQPSTVGVYAAAPHAAQAATSMVAALDAVEQVTIDAEVVSNEAAARSQVEHGDRDGLVTLGRSSTGDLTFDLFTSETSTSATVIVTRAVAQQIAVADRLVRAGLDPSQVGTAFTPPDFTVTPVDPNATNPEENFGPRYLLATILLVLMFMAIITYGQWVAASVAEEKASRVMELLITAATPRQLLLGKVLGAGGAGLTQYVVVVGAALMGILAQRAVARFILGETPSDLDLGGLDVGVLLVVGLFFVGGFALYATLYAAIGSTANRQEDIQTITGPMILIGVGGYLASFAALQSPDATWVKVLSFVPFFSPYLVPIRMVLGSISPGEIAVAFVILIVGAGIALWVAARIYSAGVLLYGQRAGLRAVWRAVRVSR